MTERMSHGFDFNKHFKSQSLTGSILVMFILVGQYLTCESRVTYGFSRPISKWLLQDWKKI